MLGDFNVAPEDRDVWSPKAFKGSTHVTEPERDAVAPPATTGAWSTRSAHRYDDDRLFTLLGLPPRRLPPAPRHAHRPRAGHASRWPNASRWAVVDRNARKGKQPSDHAPVIVDFADGA